MKKIITIESINGDSYREGQYNSWRKDGTVRQGNYGYGVNYGFWFFGEKFTQLKDKNIEQIIITINRQLGGAFNEVTHNFRLHNYAYRPYSKPEFLNVDFSKIIDVSRACEGVLILNSKHDIDNFINAKGFGLTIDSDEPNCYSVCSKNAKVMVVINDTNH